MDLKTVNKISQYFADQPIEKAWIFGSFARSKENSKSDIDILVNFVPGTNVTLFKYIHIKNDLETLTGKKIDLIEDGQLKIFAQTSSEKDKILIYERKVKG